MVQEYADGGDLFNLLQKYGGRLSERVTVQMVLEPFLRVLQVSKLVRVFSCPFHRLLLVSVTHEVQAIEHSEIPNKGL
jgi:hypothetical protein